MDCIDCHNRPSHNYKSPPVYFDKEMLTGAVSKEIPFFKKVSMGILKDTFSDKDTALMKIKDGITDFYKSGYSDSYVKNNDLIDNSISDVIMMLLKHRMVIKYRVIAISVIILLVRAKKERWNMPMSGIILNLSIR